MTSDTTHPGYTVAWQGIEESDPPVRMARSREEFAVECRVCGRRGIAHDLHADPDHGESIAPVLERPCPACREKERATMETDTPLTPPVLFARRSARGTWHRLRTPDSRAPHAAVWCGRDLDSGWGERAHEIGSEESRCAKCARLYRESKRDGE